MSGAKRQAYKNTAVRSSPRRGTTILALSILDVGAGVLSEGCRCGRLKRFEQMRPGCNLALDASRLEWAFQSTCNRAGDYPYDRMKSPEWNAKAAEEYIKALHLSPGAMPRC